MEDNTEDLECMISRRKSLYIDIITVLIKLQQINNIKEINEIITIIINYLQSKI